MKLHSIILIACTISILGIGSPSQGQEPSGNRPLPKIVTRVQQVLEVPTFTIGERPFFTPCFETYVPTEHYFQLFADAGTELFSFNTNPASEDHHHSRPVSPSPGVFDYSQLDEWASLVLKVKPDAMLLPRVVIGTPQWWLEANPDEMEILDNGSTVYSDPNRNPTVPKNRPFPSIVSEKWRRDSGEFLKKLVDHIQSSPYADHIFGYLICGLDTEEWYHWSSGSDQLSGYSKHMEKAFQKWLQRKYGTVESLRKAWNNPQITFESVQVPSRDERYDLGQGTFRDPARKKDVIDFYIFYNEIVPETIDYFAGVMKEATGGTKVLGAFYGFMYEFRGDPEYGHNALEKYNQSKNLDFIFVTASYGHRGPGRGGDYTRSPALSVRLHNKLWYHDNDAGSFLAYTVMKNQDEATQRRHLEVLGVADTLEGTQGIYQRGSGFAICNGMYMSFFDLHGGYFDHPELMAEVKRLNRAFNVAGRYDRQSNSEILVISDENSCSYATFRSDLLESSLLAPQINLVKMGAPADHVLINDLELLNTDPYKLVIFLNCYNMTDRQRKLVEQKIKNNGRHVLWCYAPGYMNDTVASPDLMKQMTGINIVPADSEEFIAPQIELRGKTVLSTLFEKPIGHPKKVCQLFSVNDSSAETLGVLPGTDKVTFAIKPMGDWTSLYAITADLPSALYRELARQAGVHIWNDRSDTFYANKTFVTLHADGAGKRTIRFPWACDVFNMVTEEQVGANQESYTYDFKDGETLILRWKVRL